MQLCTRGKAARSLLRCFGDQMKVLEISCGLIVECSSQVILFLFFEGEGSHEEIITDIQRL